MAHRYYGLNLGETENNVVNGSSTNTTDIEVNIDLAKFNKSDALIKLEEIKNAILKDASGIFG